MSVNSTLPSEETGPSGRRAPKRRRQAQAQVSETITNAGGLGMSLRPTFDEFQLRNKSCVNIRDIKEMIDRDGQVSSCFNAVVTPLKNTNFVIKPPQDMDEEAKEETDFIKRVFTMPAASGGMSSPMSSVLNEFILALRDGFACFEKVWKAVELDGKTYWTLHKLAYIPAETVTFTATATGELIRVTQRNSSTGGRSSEIDIPADKIIVYTVAHVDNPFYGKSVLLPAYFHYDKKHKLYYIMHLAYALQAVGAKLGKYPRKATADQIDKFKTDLANFGTNTTMVFEESYNVDTLSRTGTLQDLMPAIMHHDQQITKSILPHFIGLGLQTTPIGDDKSLVTLFEISLNGLLRDIGNILNSTIIPELIQYNFGTTNYPTIQFDAIPHDRITLSQEIFMRLIATKSVTPTAEFLQGLERILSERVGLTIDYSQYDPEDMVPDIINGAPAGAGRPPNSERGPIRTDGADGRTATSADDPVEDFCNRMLTMMNRRISEIEAQNNTL
jgi:hypothetical protein